ncbi:hypothetical protein EMCRGX_G015122 [Ephydatia muelleri]
MAAKQSAGVLVQYVAVRGDLWRVQKWPIGALIAQGCHATTAVLHTFVDDPNVREYLADVDHMHKVNDEADLLALASSLRGGEVDHKLWMEQPENIPTCLATKPYPKSCVQDYFKKFKLFK